MKPSDEERREELLIGLLADYDEALVAEASTAAIDSTAAQLDPPTATEWAALKQCVTRLERMRRDRGLMNSAMGSTATVNSMSIAASGDRLATASTDSSVRVFDFPSGQPQHCFLGHEGRVWRVAWSADEKAIASAGSDGTVRIWDFQASSSQRHLRKEKPNAAGRNMLDFAYLQDGQHVNAAFADGSNETWSIKSALPVSSEQIAGPRLQTDGPIPQKARFQATSHALLPHWHLQAASIPALNHRAVPEDPGDYTVSCARHNGQHIVELVAGQVRLWDVEPLKILQEREMDGYKTTRFVCDISPDGKKACLIRMNGHVEIHDLNSSTSIDLGEIPTGAFARFSSTGERLLIPAAQCFEYDARTGSRIRELVVSEPYGVCYSADSQRIAVSSRLDFVSVFDAVTGEETLRLDTHGSETMVFAPDGTSLTMRYRDELYLLPGSSETAP